MGCIYMKKYLVNYADSNYRDTQNYNTKTGYVILDALRRIEYGKSLFSLLCKKYRVPVIRDPSEYGIQPLLYPSLQKIRLNNKNLYSQIMESYNGEIIKVTYPQIVVEHRSKKVNVRTKIEAFIRRRCPTSIWINYLAIKKKFTEAITVLN